MQHAACGFVVESPARRLRIVPAKMFTASRRVGVTLAGGAARNNLRRCELNRVDEFLASFPFAESTKDSYRRVLFQLAAVNFSDWKAADLVRFVSRPEWGSNQRYVALCACRKFIRWLYGPGHPALAARVPPGRAKPQRYLSPEKAMELLAQFDTTSELGRRNLAIASLFLDTGLRVSEVCRALRRDCDLSARTLHVVVKGGQWRTVFFSVPTAQYLDNWLSVRRFDTPPLFCNLRTGEAFTREGLKKIVRDWGLQIGIKLSPHDFRRTFATLSTQFGAPSRVVQVAGRWSHIDMVERYTQGIAAREIEPYFPVARLMGQD